MEQTPEARRGGKNGVDRFGNVKHCSRCNSIYHLAKNCYANIKKKEDGSYYVENVEEPDIEDEVEGLMNEIEINLFTDVKQTVTYAEAFVVESLGQVIEEHISIYLRPAIIHSLAIYSPCK